MHGDDQRELETLDFRLRVLLPEQYQGADTDVQPVSMSSAGLKFDAAGRVAWDEIWGSFCDLAMAGGPPHKGRLLEPATTAAVAAAPERYDEVTTEICRGIVMTTDLPATASTTPGWVRVDCLSTTMAAWLVRAITMENVAVRVEGRALDLPAAPAFRLDKEIKNVVTVMAKTCHYWLGHMPREQKAAVADLFASLRTSEPFIEPGRSEEGGWPESHRRLATTMAAAIHRDTGLAASPHEYAGWLGLECASVRTAIWMMRGLVAGNVLARREETVLFVPVNPARVFSGETVVRALARLHHLAVATSALP